MWAVYVLLCCAARAVWILQPPLPPSMAWCRPEMAAVPSQQQDVCCICRGACTQILSTLLTTQQVIQTPHCPSPAYSSRNDSCRSAPKAGYPDCLLLPYLLLAAESTHRLEAFGACPADYPIIIQAGRGPSGGYAGHEVNVNRLCQHMVSQECLQAESPDACVNQLIDQVVAAEAAAAAAQSGLSGSKLAVAVAVPVVVAGKQGRVACRGYAACLHHGPCAEEQLQWLTLHAWVRLSRALL